MSQSSAKERRDALSSMVTNMLTSLHAKYMDNINVSPILLITRCQGRNRQMEVYVLIIDTHFCSKQCTDAMEQTRPTVTQHEL